MVSERTKTGMCPKKFLRFRLPSIPKKPASLKFYCTLKILAHLLVSFHFLLQKLFASSLQCCRIFTLVLIRVNLFLWVYVQYYMT